MAQQITAVFNSQESSSAAEARLRAEGFWARRQGLEAGPHRLPSRAEFEDADFHNASGGKDESQSIVTVEAPFGHATRAIGLLAEFGPVSIEEEDRHVIARRLSPSAVALRGARNADAGIVRSRDHSFFVSTLLGLPLLVNCPAPLSALLHLPTLIRE